MSSQKGQPQPQLWPRMLDVSLAALYFSVGEQTIRDWVADEILTPIEMPGCLLRDKAGNITARPRQRKLAKLLFDRQDLDEFIDKRKGAA